MLSSLAVGMIDRRPRLIARCADAAEVIAVVNFARENGLVDLTLSYGRAVSFAAEACCEAVRFVNEAAGTSAIRLGSSFERYFRDARVLDQHASKSSPRYASAGR